MRYPEATWKGDGKSGGSYVGKPFRVVLHTTETAGVPGYGGGASAPHITYVPKARQWVQHTDFNTAARALRNVSGGVQTNRANALQVELVCYSAKNIADQSSSRLWVGELSDDHYQDLRDFLAWTYANFDVTATWPEKQAFSSRQANAPGFRMTDTEWNEFDGVCAHQHVPENTHWDTGALDWTQLIQDTPTGEDLMLPLNKGARSEDIRLAKDRMNETYGTSLDLEGNNPDGALYDQALVDACKDHLVQYTGDKRGVVINAKMWNGLFRDFIIEVAPVAPPSSGVTTAEVKSLIADTTLVP